MSDIFAQLSTASFASNVGAEAVRNVHGWDADSGRTRMRAEFWSVSWSSLVYLNIVIIRSASLLRPERAASQGVPAMSLGMSDGARSP
jgi:hypothetical protein